MRVDLRRVSARRPDATPAAVEPGAVPVPEQPGIGSSRGGAGNGGGRGAGETVADAPPTTGVPRAVVSRDAVAHSWHHTEATAADPVPSRPVEQPRTGEQPRPVEQPRPAVRTRPDPTTKTPDAFDDPSESAEAEPRSEQTRPGPAHARTSPPPSRRREGGLLLLAGGASAVAAFLPWSTLTGGDETRTFDGVTAGDGRLSLVAGLVLIAVGVSWLRGAARPGTGRPGAGWLGDGSSAGTAMARLAALLIVAVSGFDLAFGPPPLASFRGISADVFELRPELGVGVTLVAGLVALFASTRRDRGGRAKRR
ncbi:hypothetical protein [Parafrankia sp. CH37]|nr:hypothetical protein [Parafrankia sp. CH37]